MTGLASAGKPPTAKLSPEELERLWADLAGATSSRTHSAVWLLASRPEQTIPFLRERLKPAPVIDPQLIARLLIDLDSEQYSVREKANRELRKLSENAEPALRKVLTAKTSLEFRQRVERLLDALSEWSPENLRGLRAIEILEHADSTDAKSLLQALAKGSPDARLTRAAEASLKSLHRRQVALGKAVSPVKTR